MISMSFGLLMIMVVFAGAIAFAFTDYMDDRLYGNKRIFFIFMLVAYGIYRGFRLFSLFKKTGNDD